MLREFKVGSYNIEAGVEIGYIDTFFSSRDPSLGNVVTRKSIEGNSYKYSFGKTNFDIHVEDLLESSCRELSLNFTDDVELMDIVQRFVLNKDDVDYISIGDKQIYHKRHNFYHQFPAENVTIHFKDGHSFEFIPKIECSVEGMEPLVYVRDEPNKWIFHIRLLSTTPSKYITKGCMRFFNRPFPSWIQNVFSFFGLQKPTLYLRERVSQRIPFQTNGSSLIKKGTTISISSTWTQT
jgi:hypothetical protein